VLFLSNLCCLRNILVPEHGPSGVQVYKQWVPWPLRSWFYIPLILVMIGGGIVLEVMLHVTDKRNGVFDPFLKDGIVLIVSCS
jgi:hypothetical protein